MEKDKNTTRNYEIRNQYNKQFQNNKWVSLAVTFNLQIGTYQSFRKQNDNQLFHIYCSLYGGALFTFISILKHE